MVVNKMGGACAMYGRDERCLHGFGGETSWKEASLKTWSRWEVNVKMDL
jgi:hypothetical protein